MAYNQKMLLLVAVVVVIAVIGAAVAFFPAVPAGGIGACRANIDEKIQQVQALSTDNIQVVFNVLEVKEFSSYDFRDYLVEKNARQATLDHYFNANVDYKGGPYYVGIVHMNINLPIELPFPIEENMAFVCDSTGEFIPETATFIGEIENSLKG